MFIRIRVYKHFTSVRPLMHFYRAMEEKVCACTVVNGYRLYAKLPSGSDTIKQRHFLFHTLFFIRPGPAQRFADGLVGGRADKVT